MESRQISDDRVRRKPHKNQTNPGNAVLMRLCVITRQAVWKLGLAVEGTSIRRVLPQKPDSLKSREPDRDSFKERESLCLSG